MATITASTPTSFVAGTALLGRAPAGASSFPLLGLAGSGRSGRVRCSAEGKPSSADGKTKMSSASLLAAAAAGAASMSGPALALVDERMSTEGTGLSLGVSNNFLGWILLGVFGLIWALYFSYTSTLEEDEESGLSL